MLTQDLFYIAPEIFLTLWGLIVLTVDFTFFRKATSSHRRVVLGVLSLLGVVASLALVYFDLPTALGRGYPNTDDPSLFFGTLAGDTSTSYLNLVVLGLLALVAGMSIAWNFTEHWGEYYALLLWAGVGMMFLIAAEELLVLFLSLEMMTICLYLAASFEKTKLRSAEAGLKYFVYGSVSSALFLFGLSLIYGLTGSTRLDTISRALTETNAITGLKGNVAGAVALLLVLVGFGFKIAAVPFHQWAPDTYEGAPAPVTAWIASGSKVASFVALLKVLVHALGPWAHRPGSLIGPGWIGIVGLIAAVTMTYGNFAALAQRNLKRMLAYSSIAHAGYLLVGVLAASTSVNKAGAAGAVLFYLVVYGFSTAGAFALAGWLARDKNTDDINDLNGLGFQAPGLAVCIVLLMLSLIGMPPLAGFFGKLYMFMEAIDTSQPGHVALVWLVGLALANSVVSAFYYVRVLKAMFLRAPGRIPFASPPSAVTIPIILGTAVAVGFGVLPSVLLEPMNAAAFPMLSERGESSTTNSKFVTGADPNFQVPDMERRVRENAARLKGLTQASPRLITPTKGATPQPVPKGTPKSAPRAKGAAGGGRRPASQDSPPRPPDESGGVQKKDP